MLIKHVRGQYVLVGTDMGVLYALSDFGGGKEGCFVFVSAKNVFSAFHKTGK